jgi:alkylation response protein AidB-like acyl-CoA dehydrogenase
VLADMQLEFTADQEELRDSVRAVLVRECPIRVVRSVVEDGAAPDALWKQMVELGWPALTVPEADGGLGLGWVDLAVVVEELGRAVAPGPYVATVGLFLPAVQATADAGQRARLLPQIAEGSLTGALALTEAAGGSDPATVQARAVRDGTGWRLAGTKTAVLSGDVADELLVVARQPGSEGDDGVVALLVPRAAVSVSPERPLDATRGLVDLTLDGVRVDADRVLGEPGPATAAALRGAVEAGAVVLAVEIVGTCQAILDVTLEYAKHREQFGVAIGSFQAIKHKFADLLISLERARATSYFAALCVDEHDPRRSIAASTAKAAAGDCQQLLSKEGIQIHGGIGYTWEHDMHLYVRRAKTDAALLGNTHEHRARIANELLGP